MPGLGAAQPEHATAGYLGAYGRMLLIRRFEAAMERLRALGEVQGPIHPYAGREAVAVGVCMALEPADYVSGHDHGHGHALAKGTDPEALAAELLGRETGVCGGRAGAASVIDLQNGLIGCHGTVGGSIAAAVGAGLAAGRRGRVAVAFFGGPSADLGYFHECMGIAAVRRLPVVLVCERDLHAERARGIAGADVAGRAAAHGMPSQVVDGDDLWAVRAAAAAAVARARSGEGPTLLECRARGLDEDSGGAGTMPRDPLAGARERLLADGVAADVLQELERGVEAELDRAVDRALAAPHPDPAGALATEFSPAR